MGQQRCGLSLLLLYKLVKIGKNDLTGNESVPKIIINDTINFFFRTAISILVISNYNSFRELFDKIASVYFI